MVGEYAKKMISDYKDALRLVEDYFQLKCIYFLEKCFPGSKADNLHSSLSLSIAVHILHSFTQSIKSISSSSFVTSFSVSLIVSQSKPRFLRKVMSFFFFSSGGPESVRSFFSAAERHNAD